MHVSLDASVAITLFLTVIAGLAIYRGRRLRFWSNGDEASLDIEGEQGPKKLPDKARKK